MTNSSITVGRQIDTVEGLIRTACKEKAGNECVAVVPVIADVRRAWHDTAADLSL